MSRLYIQNGYRLKRLYEHNKYSVDESVSVDSIKQIYNKVKKCISGINNTTNFLNLVNIVNQNYEQLKDDNRVKLVSQILNNGINEKSVKESISKLIEYEVQMNTNAVNEIRFNRRSRIYDGKDEGQKAKIERLKKVAFKSWYSGLMTGIATVITYGDTVRGNIGKVPLILFASITIVCYITALLASDKISKLEKR